MSLCPTCPSYESPCHPVVQCRSCYLCPDGGPCSSHNAKQTQKIIKKQVRVASSLYMMNLSALTASTNQLSITNYSQGANSKNLKDPGVAIKHNSYDRYLAKLKSKSLKNNGKNHVIIENCKCK